MRLYFAGNAGSVQGEATCVNEGVSSRLVTFAERGLRGSTEFWIDGRHEALKLYFAGSGATSIAQEMSDIGAGVQNRLLTFAAIDKIEGQKRWTPWQREMAQFWLAARESLLRCEEADGVKLYVAGNGKASESDLKDYEAGTRNRLLSYAFLSDWAKEAFKFWVNHAPREASVFLDSGAFSAKTRGTVIDIERYCQYIDAHRHALAAYAVLDVIGDAEASQVNLDYMRKRGLDPVPVYHVAAEPLSVLDRILADHTGYVALGGMASESATRDQVRTSLDACWRVIEKRWDAARPVRVHGLGVMAQWALERYPWYSCDGSSAIVAAGMGRVSSWNDGRPDVAGRWPELGRFVSLGWVKDGMRDYDGQGVDGVGRVAASAGKSESAHSGRRRRNILAQLALERHVTDVWARQGVTWS